MAALAIAPLQDLLNLGAESRMNVPGRAGGNWRWRSPETMLWDGAFDWLRELTKTSKRSDITVAVQQVKLKSEDSVQTVASQI
jgi:4-alpha-glucanotransferase